MYALVGITNNVYQERIGEAFLDHYEEEIVALFHDRRDAKKYMNKARLKKPRRESFSGTVWYRDRSVLRGCADAYIQEYDEPQYPINPEL